MKEYFEKTLKPYMVEPMLQLGCAENKEPGFITLDKNPEVKPDIEWDLGDIPFPSPSNKYGFILATHVLEHLPFHKVLRLMPELYRVLKPGGHLFVAVPHGASDDAWENPHHKSYWTGNTFSYFTPDLYKVGDTAGLGAGEGHNYAPWEIVWVNLIVHDEYKVHVEDIGPEDFGRWASSRRNVYREVQSLMKKGVQ